MRKILILIFFLDCIIKTGVAFDNLNYISFERIQVNDNFWSSRLQINREVTIPHNLEKCREVGIIDNFARAGGLQNGEYIGLFIWDETFYKTIEAASYCLLQEYDPDLDKQLDSLITIISSAQEEDGYLQTNYTLALRKGKNHAEMWTNLRSGLELYCAGHLYESAVAHHRATGKTSLLNVALKNADVPYDEPSATRKEWFPCACCPPNFARYLPQIPQFIYAQNDEALYINLFIGNQTSLQIKDSQLDVAMETNYPWNGNVKIKLQAQTPLTCDLRIRIPG